MIALKSMVVVLVLVRDNNLILSAFVKTARQNYCHNTIYLFKIWNKKKDANVVQNNTKKCPDF